MNQSISEIVQDIEFIKDALTSIRDKYEVSVEDGYVPLKVVSKKIHTVLGKCEIGIDSKPKIEGYLIKISGLPREPIFNRLDSDHNSIAQYLEALSKYHQELTGFYTMISEFLNRISDSFEIFNYHGAVTIISRGRVTEVKFGVKKI